MTIPATTSLAGLTVDQFDAGAQDSFKDSLASVMTGVSADDINITSIVTIDSGSGVNSTNSSRRLDEFDGKKKFTVSRVLEQTRSALSGLFAKSSDSLKFVLVPRFSVQASGGIIVNWELRLIFENFVSSSGGSGGGTVASPQALFAQLSSQLTEAGSTGTLLEAMKSRSSVFANVNVSVVVYELKTTVKGSTPLPTHAPTPVPTLAKAPAAAPAAVPLGLIIGVAVGGGVLLIGLVVFVWWYLRRKNSPVAADN